ncbi:MAG: hypothetical protein Q4B46_07380 [Comamonadaceae bacterium]|nr:hypothetical protein [Comamonadaceae bacterium]
MYLIVIAWFYVTLMMALAEGFSPQGTALGAIMTFVLYGLLPMSIVVYILATPERKRRLKARREAEQRAYEEAQALQTGSRPASAAHPDASSHAPRTAQDSSVAPMREKL